MFTLAGLFFGIPVVGSFHTDILDLLRTHNAFGFQKLLVSTKERIDSFVFDSCATTSQSFKDKLRDQGVTCEHVIQTAVDTTMFSPSKFNMFVMPISELNLRVVIFSHLFQRFTKKVYL